MLQNKQLQEVLDKTRSASTSFAVMAQVVAMTLDANESLCLDSEEDKVVLFNRLCEGLWSTVCGDLPFERK